MKDDDIVKDAREFFAEAQSHEADWREDWKDDLAFRDLQQWSSVAEKARAGGGKDGEPARPTLTIDMTDQYLRQIVNDARMNPPAMKAIPMDDKGDVEVAQHLNGMFRYIEAVSRAPYAYINALDYAVTIGRGAFRVRTVLIDAKRNLWEPRIEPIDNPLLLYFDPYSTRLDGSDANDAMLITRLSKREFKRRYPGAERTHGWDGAGEQEATWLTDEGILVAEWHRVSKKTETVVRADDGEMSQDEARERKPENFREESKESRVCTVRTMTGCEEIEANDAHFQSVGLVPVYGVVRNDGAGKRSVRGALRPAKDPQRLFNFLASNFAEASSSAPRAPWVIPFDAVSGFEHFWEGANRLPLGYLPYNHKDSDGAPLPSPQRQMADLNLMGYVSAMQSVATFIQGAMGQYQASIGAPSNETSGRAINAREQQSDRGSFHFNDNLACSVQHAGRLVMQCLPKVFDQRRVMQILGEDGEQDQIVIDPNQRKPLEKGKHPSSGKSILILNPMLGEYDIQISTGASFTSRRQEAVAMMREMLSGDQNLTQLVGDLFFGMMDAPGAKEIAARMKLMLPDVIKAAEEAGEDVQPEVVAIVQRLTEMLKAREEGFTATMGELQKLGEQIRDEHAKLKDAAANLKMDEANIKIERHELDMARNEIQGLLDTPIDPMTGQPIQQQPALPVAAQQPASPGQQEAQPVDDGLAGVLMQMAQAQEQMMAAQQQTNDLLAGLVQALSPAQPMPAESAPAEAIPVEQAAPEGAPMVPAMMGGYQPQA